MTFDFTFQGYDAGKLHVQDPIVASTACQMASIYADGRFTNDKSVGEEATPGELAYNRSRPRLNASLTVYRSGAFDPARIQGGTATTVAGRKSVRATLPVDLDQGRTLAAGNKVLAWEYADNAWAVVTSISNSADEPSFTDLEALIPGFEPGTPEPALVPFTVGYVPAGYEPAEIGSHALPGPGGINLARDGNYGGARYSASRGGGLTIFVVPSRNTNGRGKAGEIKCFRWGGCSVTSADGKVTVEVGSESTGPKLPEAELTRIARSIKVADVTDEATWTPADKALRP